MLPYHTSQAAGTHIMYSIQSICAFLLLLLLLLLYLIWSRTAEEACIGLCIALKARLWPHRMRRVKWGKSAQTAALAVVASGNINSRHSEYKQCELSGASIIFFSFRSHKFVCVRKHVLVVVASMIQYIYNCGTNQNSIKMRKKRPRKKQSEKKECKRMKKKQQQRQRGAPLLLLCSFLDQNESD